MQSSGEKDTGVSLVAVQQGAPPYLWGEPAAAILLDPGPQHTTRMKSLEWHARVCSHTCARVNLLPLDLLVYVLLRFRGAIRRKEAPLWAVCHVVTAGRRVNNT